MRNIMKEQAVRRIERKGQTPVEIIHLWEGNRKVFYKGYCFDLKGNISIGTFKEVRDMCEDCLNHIQPILDLLSRKIP